MVYLHLYLLATLGWRGLLSGPWDDSACHSMKHARANSLHIIIPLWGSHWKHETQNWVFVGHETSFLFLQRNGMALRRRELWMASLTSISNSHMNIYYDTSDKWLINYHPTTEQPEQTAWVLELSNVYVCLIFENTVCPTLQVHNRTMQQSVPGWRPPQPRACPLLLLAAHADAICNRHLPFHYWLAAY